MKYIYTLSEKGNLLEFNEYDGEPLQDNQTIVQYTNYFANPCFNFETQEWYDGEPIAFEPPKPKTKEELLQEEIEETKRKTVTEFELRKVLAEEQRNNIKMMMMMLAKK